MTDLHVIRFLDPRLQRGHVLERHILHDHEGERALAEVVQQRVLADDRVHVVGQGS